MQIFATQKMDFGCFNTFLQTAKMIANMTFYRFKMHNKVIFNSFSPTKRHINQLENGNVPPVCVFNCRHRATDLAFNFNYPASLLLVETGAVATSYNICFHITQHACIICTCQGVMCWLSRAAFSHFLSLDIQCLIMLVKLHEQNVSCCSAIANVAFSWRPQRERRGQIDGELRCKHLQSERIFKLEYI